ncbi:hypothetical protein L2Y94_02220 [Luteibacter aegosomatis]|uniref:hypothetical protein n=1 Tax=Luteibacter aegosomatis TaxID=2911537 RepID=UPI001FFA4782|nr:hypothetical protein [Luteibacter aegosomatis]UPG86203.1 hypothetical protein L2Y94_02220 [Luteibacter aegosomatis]
MTTYFLSVKDISKAKGPDPDLSFEGIGPDKLAADIVQAMRSDDLFQRWRAKQPEPDEVDPSLGVTDPGASATGELSPGDRHDVTLTTSLPMRIVKHRLNLLIGSSWELRDTK